VEVGSTTMTSRAQSRLREGARLSLIGLLLNAVLALSKLVAGVLGHSYALVADAIESTLDIFGSFIVWRGLRIAALPADEEHPYGHGRAESLAGLIVAVVLFAAAAGIAIGAIIEILIPQRTPAPFTLAVLLGVVAIKETMFRITRRTARRTESGALLTDAWHHRSDAISSAAAAIGITIALVGGEPYAQADKWAALFAAGVIAYNASRLVRQPLHELMDATSPAITHQARNVAAAVPSVAGVEKVLARKTGVSYWIDMHVEVQPEMSVRDAHGVAHDVKDAIRAAMPNVCEVSIHIEPHQDGAR